MLYTIKLKDDEAFENIVEKGLICIDMGLKEKTDDFSSYKKILLEEDLLNREDASLFIENIKDLSPEDNILIEVDGKFFLGEVEEKAKISQSLILIKAEAFSYDLDRNLENFFDSKTISRIDGEFAREIKDDFYKLKNQKQEIKYEIIKAKNSLMKIEKQNLINEDILKNIKEGSKGELIIELDPPEYKDESLPTLYQEESLEQMYLNLLKNQIDFCLKLQEMTTKELIKTQELFNQFFRNTRKN